MSTEYDLINQRVVEYSAGEDAGRAAMTKQYKNRLGECDMECAWHPIYGWVPESDCPAHDNGSR